MEKIGALYITDGSKNGTVTVENSMEGSQKI